MTSALLSSSLAFVTVHFFTVNAPAAAAEPKTGGFDLLQLLQFGVVGLILGCLVLRKFFVPEWTLRDAEARLVKAEEQARQREAQAEARIAKAEERADSYREQLDHAQAFLQQEVIPALTQVTSISAKYADELAAQRYRRGTRGGAT